MQLMRSTTYGRDRELGLLKRALISERAPTVCLHGMRGSGRTSLARYFLESHLAAFPAGTLWVAERQRDGVGPDEVDLSYLDNLAVNDHSLVVFDDTDAMPINTLSREIRELRQKRPLNQVLMTSVLPFHVGEESRAVAMPPLSTAGILEILHSDAPL